MLNIVNVIAVIIFLVCWFFIIKKLVTDKISSVKSVKAVISHKYKTNIRIADLSPTISINI